MVLQPRHGKKVLFLAKMIGAAIGYDKQVPRSGFMYLARNVLVSRFNSN